MSMVNPELEDQIRASLSDQDRRMAVTALIRGYGPAIFGYMMSRLRDREAANEVFAQFCEQMCRDIASFRGESAVLTWAQRVAGHTVDRFLRTLQSSRARTVALGTSGWQRAADALKVDSKCSHSATHPYLHTEVRSRVAELLKTLTAAEQELVELHVEKGLRWRAIAQLQLARKGQLLDERGVKRHTAALRQQYCRLLVRLGRRLVDDGKLRLDVILERYSGLDRDLVELAFRQRLPRQTVLLQVHARYPSMTRGALAVRFQRLLTDLLELCGGAGLLPGEAAEAGLLDPEDTASPAGMGPRRRARKQ